MACTPPRRPCILTSAASAEKPPRWQEYVDNMSPWFAMGLAPAASTHKIAIGLTGEPVARASRSGATTHRNDHCLNSAHSGARAEKSR